MASGDQSSLYLNEIRSLSELPMNRLIHLRSSLANNNDINSEHENENIVSSRTLPWTMPMALSMSLKKNNKKPIRRHEEHYDEKGKDTKISKIFQLAITALSFLAFGGYLLTLIITAIRRNNGNGNGNVVILSNLQSLQKLNRPKRNILIFDPMENNFETDKLYEGMIMLSRSYALYN
ncbi:PREDICTED: uncharacterized protein LOC108749577 [Trachymyrmex septentrionalis]|uniref:uncharacterized protein LOC108749577 n=1 Tax=Trachymyrmex septentrionalis TaxID=34720 RepID=UPI00084EF2AC|nr:PREDICTED: uncharacterized protein LOC108749577 [Trachymyrmex septentrionalis]